MSVAHVIFAAGCFWGVQATFDNVPGVISTEVGYTGGSIKNPTYEQVSTGKTGHAEAVEVTYNPDKVSYQQLLNIFFQSHNPTTLNRQGPDIGEQYRSAVFYQTLQEKEQIEQTISRLNQSGKYKNPIVTQVLPEQSFYPAEEYHQKYLAKKGWFLAMFRALKKRKKNPYPKLKLSGNKNFHLSNIKFYDRKAQKSLLPESSYITKPTGLMFAGLAVIRFLNLHPSLIPAAVGQALIKPFRTA